MSVSTASPFDPVDAVVADIAEGKLVVVTDDEGRENEGDLVMAGSKATAATVNMMIRHARGLICVPTIAAQLRRLSIGPMVQENRESQKTAFTISVDAAEGITTGISAADRARTIAVLADPESAPDALVQPGHVFPLRAKEGGVLERAGHTEAAVDLAKLAGLPPTGVICEILNEDGAAARLPELVEFKRRFGLRMVSIAALIEYRHQREQLVEHVCTRDFPSEYGAFTLQVFRSRVDDRHHLAFTMGTLGPEPILVRVHSENLLSDVFRAKGMESHHSLTGALDRVAREGRGVVLYMEQPDGGRDSLRRLLETPGTAPAPVSFRDYGIGAQILVALGLRKIRLLTHSSRRVVALDGYGLEIVEQVHP
ncbi:MAG: 3,4-dihydroxy-2-butanone 4-phosphate synthase [Verrucomicrobia bacterium]|nr:3,4-dihydroxy-2-butanone 4-phosphate synthase [Verrucomicrobiota bacterium]